MAKNKHFDRKALLENLPRVKYEKGEDKKSSFLEKMSMDRALLGLLQIDHDHEYELCKSVAQHLLEQVPEPQDIDM